LSFRPFTFIFAENPRILASNYLLPYSRDPLSLKDRRFRVVCAVLLPQGSSIAYYFLSKTTRRIECTRCHRVNIRSPLGFPPPLKPFPEGVIDSRIPSFLFVHFLLSLPSPLEFPRLFQEGGRHPPSLLHFFPPRSLLLRLI